MRGNRHYCRFLVRVLYIQLLCLPLLSITFFESFKQLIVPDFCFQVTHTQTHNSTLQLVGSYKLRAQRRRYLSIILVKKRLLFIIRIHIRYKYQTLLFLPCNASSIYMKKPINRVIILFSNWVSCSRFNSSRSFDSGQSCAACFFFLFDIRLPYYIIAFILLL